MHRLVVFSPWKTQRHVRDTWTMRQKYYRSTTAGDTVGLFRARRSRP